MTPRTKKLLITAGILTATFVALKWVILPQMFPSVACVYKDPSSGEVTEQSGQQCYEIPGAIVLTVD